MLVGSGLYDRLVQDELLIPHQEVSPINFPTGVYRIIKPELIEFLSYPYEWCFGQLKDAALATLKIQSIAMEYGMSLKDASAYNIQFRKGKPVLIDTLSFEKYRHGEPWVAYRQFCQHFAAPLSLMFYKDMRLNQLLRVYIDGVPLDLADKLLTFRAKRHLWVFIHIHLHAKLQKDYSSKMGSKRQIAVSKNNLNQMLSGLADDLNRLEVKGSDTEWGDYYENTNYAETSFKLKQNLVDKLLDVTETKTAWDLGANTGVFSRILSRKGIFTVSFDIDWAAVHKNYTQMKNDHEENLLPLVLDLTNPSPNIGWDNDERHCISGRGKPDTILALALIHHLSISNNLPFNKTASFFSENTNHLIIEFVPKSDSQVERLLSTREDVFSQYNQLDFEAEYQKFFSIITKYEITGTDRVLYLMKKLGV